jgi:hypothetical protein
VERMVIVSLSVVNRKLIHIRSSDSGIYIFCRDRMQQSGYSSRSASTGFTCNAFRAGR